MRDNHFINCNFSEAYFGKPRGVSGKVNFSKLNVCFTNCRFDEANFKGAIGLSLSHFSGCTDLISAKHLSKKIYNAFKNTPCAISPEKIKKSESMTGFTNAAIRPSNQCSITDFFSPKNESTNGKITPVIKKQESPELHTQENKFLKLN